DANNGGKWQGDRKASINAQLMAADLVNYIDLDRPVSYGFRYLSTTKDGDIRCNNGKANLEFSGLDVGQSGTLSLDLLENGQAKLRGVINNFTLKVGLNEIALELQLVGGNGNGGANDHGNGGGGNDTATTKLSITPPDVPD